ncbi:PAT family beta-lactamase induction signal transducer AmpG [Sphingopyxis sp. OAS728]|uniref:AmpG family muropeptide MFS transporter n=1 Tax=Sphingopyxis sp. OAS728 TaxID=2663823 RepID=UPI00178A1354|nr:MFS transporter [Sphingopyxis sp. OAS728]MBE1526165.1 PAT family beta-lactamase induction signal transducer AmpG [Sphingopyxis sp. OAS728]
MSTDAAMPAPQGWRDSLRPYLEPAPLAALFLGISSGFPFAMIGATLTTRLAQDGIEKSSVTAFALTFLAYNLKWAWAPAIDRLRIPILGSIGQRRSWLILVGALVFVAVSVLGNLDPKASLAVVALAAIAVGLAGATYDIVIDAYRIELLSPEQLGTGSGMSQYGWRIGAAVAGALALVVAERAGWGVAYMVCAALVLPAIVTGLVMGEPERKIERHWPAYLSRAYYAVFIFSFPIAFLVARQVDQWLDVDILTLMVLVGYLFPLFDLSARRARDIGWSGRVNWIIALPALALVAVLAADWGTITAYVGATLLGAVLAVGAIAIAALVALPTKSREGQSPDKSAVGPLAEFFSREGAVLILFFLLLHKIGDTLANLTFRLLFEDLGYTNDEIAFYDVGLGFWALLAGVFVGGIIYARLGMKRSVLFSLILMAISNFSFAGLAAAGHSNWGMAGAIGFENFASGIGGVCVVAYLSALADLRFTATHFALFSAAASILGRFLTGTSAGKLIEEFGYVDFYLLTTALAVPGILIFWWMMRSGLVDRSIGTAGEVEVTDLQNKSAS